MATTSLWHIEGRLKDLIAYVENPEKTRAENPGLQPLWDVFSYVSRSEATEQGEYVSAVNCLKEIALQQMILTKKPLCYLITCARYHAISNYTAILCKTDI